MGVELPLRVVVTILECCVTFSGVKLSIRSFVLFKLHRRTRLTPRSSIHSLKIRMTSHPCNKYEHIMLSYLLIVNKTERKSFCVKVQIMVHGLAFFQTKLPFKTKLHESIVYMFSLVTWFKLRLLGLT